MDLLILYLIYKIWEEKLDSLLFLLVRAQG